MDTEARNSLRHLRKLLRTDRTSAHLQEYCAQKRYYNQLVRDKKASYFSKLNDTLLHGDISKFWSLIRSRKKIVSTGNSIDGIKWLNWLKELYTSQTCLYNYQPSLRTN